jgi:hypothetical protein
LIDVKERAEKEVPSVMMKAWLHSAALRVSPLWTQRWRTVNAFSARGRLALKDAAAARKSG